VDMLTADPGSRTFSCTIDPLPRLQELTGPGGAYETEVAEIDGVPVRTFVRAPRSIVDFFRSTARHAEREHLVLGEERLTFDDVRRQALAVARWLRQDAGIMSGDRVAIAMRNVPEFVTTFWGGVLAGAVVVPLNAWWTGAELHYALRDCGAGVVFADAERCERLATADGERSTPTVVGVRARGTAHTGDVAYEDVATGEPLDDESIAAPGPDDPVTILYTSGTTGRPKGALGTHRAAITNLMNMGYSSTRAGVLSGRAAPPHRGQPVSIQSAPLFHIGGMASIVGSAMGGSRLILMHKWDVDEYVAHALREGVSGLGGVPTVAREILGHPRIGELAGQVRSFPMGGTSVPPDLVRKAREVFGDAIQLLNGYGLTETGSAVCTNVGDEYTEHPDSVGRLNLTAELRVLGPDGQALGVGDVGELCFRSPQLARGYWNDPEATRAAFVDGWFHTGDLGYVDKQGYVYVVDRLKDVVIRGGENVYCAEVEAVLCDHPDVHEAAVVGLPDPVLGERVCAVVIPRAGATPTLEDIRAFSLPRLAAFKCPEAMYVTSDVPRTATGKTAKRDLRSRLVADGQHVVRSW
jgi:long-chain acyl-CoA synthetase